MIYFVIYHITYKVTSVDETASITINNLQIGHSVNHSIQTQLLSAYNNDAVDGTSELVRDIRGLKLLS
jgi:hypothetical protein